VRQKRHQSDGWKMNLDCAAKLDKLDKLDESFGKGQEGLGSLLTENSLEMELLGQQNHG